MTQKLVTGSTVLALTETSYDALGRVDCTAQRMDPTDWGAAATSACHLDPTPAAEPDRITRTGYDAAGQVTQVQTAYNTADQANEVTATYTNNGKTKTVTDGEGNLTRYDYDGHDRLGYTVFPSKTVPGTADNSDYERYVYDANGNVTMVDQRDRKTISFAYDALNRVTDKIRQYPESDVAFAYDNLGRMTSASQPFNTLTFTYDALGRKLTEVGPHGTVRSEYDLGGRRTSLTWPDNAWVSYQHLVTGETEVIRQSGTTELARFGFDNLGRRTSLTRGNGTVTSYTHDGVSRLSQLTQNLAGTSHDLTLGFTYNPASQIKTATRSNDAYAFTALVNGTVNSTVNGQNQLVTHASATITHDGRGNLTFDGSKSYSYNSENMLVSASNGAAFGYDPMNRLYSLTEAGGTRLLRRSGYDRGVHARRPGAAALRARSGSGRTLGVVRRRGPHRPPLPPRRRARLDHRHQLSGRKHPHRAGL